MKTLNYQTEVEEILSILSDRKGFDGWWDNIEGEYQQEIREELDSFLWAFRDQ